MISAPGSERLPPRRLVGAAVASSLLLVLVTAGTPQSLYSDPAWQVRAVQQYLDGISPSPNHLVQPSPTDLSQDEARWISWWAPASGLLLWPAMAAGLSAGSAARLLVAVCLFVGASGWALWIGLFRLPVRMAVALAVLLPWMRYASNALFLYSAETLVFAAAPWILLAAHSYAQHTATQGIRKAAFLTGLVFGSAYVLKYSLVFVSVGAAVFVLTELFRSSASRLGTGRNLATRAAALITGFSLPVLALSLAAYWAGSTATPVSAMHLNLSVRNLVYALATPALAAADADSLWRWLLLHPAHGITGSLFWVALIGVPGGICLFWLLARPSQQRPAVALARTVLFVTVGLLFAVWNVSTRVSYEARHVAGAALAVLPLAIARGRHRWSEAGSLARTSLGIVAILYVALPLAYGIVSVVGKVARTPRDYATARSGFYNPLLARTDAGGVAGRLIEHHGGADTVWYLPEPLSALDLPVRAVIRHAAFLSAEELRAQHFTSKKPLKLRVLVPPALEDDGRAAIIRASFRGARDWHHENVEGCNYTLWTAHLAPVGNHATGRK